MKTLKTKKVFVCSECGNQSSQWQGQCTECHVWNSIKAVTTTTATTPNNRTGFSGTLTKVQPIKDIVVEETSRLSSGLIEFDRVLGGGFVLGSSILLGGSPGAGKSTLLLQVLDHMAKKMPALYVSGEESAQQIASRAARLNLTSTQLSLLTETCCEKICSVAEQEQTGIIVIDSIQVMYTLDAQSAPGGVTQVRESASFLTRFAKLKGIILLIVGHVTKDNAMAGPMTLSHIVDTQLALGATDDSKFRMIRATKNRFGQVNELGIFAMTEKGLKEVKNPSAIFLSRSPEPVSGSVISIIWEGTRAILVEIQALVVSSQLGNPRRVTIGLEQNRLSMLLAVLTRHGGIFTHDQDVFINVVGGIRITETSADLANIIATVSSFKDIPLPKDLVVFGEVGLSGEIRPIVNGQERLIEAAKHGFTHAIVPLANVPRKKINGLKTTGVIKLSDALDQCH